MDVAAGWVQRRGAGLRAQDLAKATMEGDQVAVFRKLISNEPRYRSMILDILLDPRAAGTHFGAPFR